MNDFLPVSRADMDARGWDQLDFLYISGDAYVDHSSFGHAIIMRVLEKEGFRVGIIPQPDWHSKEDFLKLGRPKLGVLISSGNMDSMVNHYTAAKKRRSEDAYSPGGEAGHRPDRAVIVYANRVREAFGDIPIIIGGIEASLRRFAHYDYWADGVRRSILADAKADLLIYGMGERPIREIAAQLKNGTPVSEIHGVRGTCYLTGNLSEIDDDSVHIPSYEEVISDKRAYAEAVRLQYEEQDAVRGKTVVQPHGNRFLVQLPPSMPLNRKELDAVYALPFTGEAHPMYEPMGGIPALSEVRFSITSARGCFGNCSFCALAFHQGRVVQSRSKASILAEAKKMVWHPDFKGYIHDVGGPSANFRFPACDKQLKSGTCKNRQCLYPKPCKQMKINHREYLEVLRALRELPQVKKVFVRSGIRYDYLIHDPDDTFFRELVEHHVSGQLKVAPEHISDRVLYYMGKPSRSVYERFAKKFKALNEEMGKKQYLVPYLMSSHPGSTLEDAISLAEYLRDIHYHPEQVQDFYPTPGTLSTCMFYTGLDPMTGKKVYVPRTAHEKALQRALLQYRNPQNYTLVREALLKAGREDLIGFSPKCLIRPRQLKKEREEMAKNPHNKPQKSSKSKEKGAKQNGSKNHRRQTGVSRNQGRGGKKG